jgi:hypothetical protein
MLQREKKRSNNERGRTELVMYFLCSVLELEKDLFRAGSGTLNRSGCVRFLRLCLRAGTRDPTPRDDLLLVKSRVVSSAS